MSTFRNIHRSCFHSKQSFFIAQLKQRCHNDADIHAFPIMLRDPAICNSAEKMELIFERLNGCDDKLAIRTKVLDEIANRICMKYHSDRVEYYCYNCVHGLQSTRLFPHKYRARFFNFSHPIWWTAFFCQHSLLTTQWIRNQRYTTN